jgi:predicted ATPase
MLTDLYIRNYKSLRRVELRKIPLFNTVIGANASGKSNFVDALDFLSHLSRFGLSSAVQHKGGFENICFRKVRRSKAPIYFSLTINDSYSPRAPTAYTINYSFSIKTTTRSIKSDYRVEHEELKWRTENSRTAQIAVRRRAGHQPEIDLAPSMPDHFPLPFPKDYLPQLIRNSEWPEDELIFATPGFPMLGLLSPLLASARVYQISPDRARLPGVPQRSAELGRNGDNLPAAVDYLAKNHPNEFELLISHLNHAVSTMLDIETDYVETKELGLFFRERGFGRRWYSQDVSDGTIKTVAMYLALLDPRFDIVAIEEPENSLHPWILRHFIDSCLAQVANKQIWLTTHSPIGVDKVPIECLWIAKRKDGSTTIDRLETLVPSVRQIVEEELFGLGEYWDSGAVGGIPETEIELVE